MAVDARFETKRNSLQVAGIARGRLMQTVRYAQFVNLNIYFFILSKTQFIYTVLLLKQCLINGCDSVMHGLTTADT